MRETKKSVTHNVVLQSNIRVMIKPKNIRGFHQARNALYGQTGEPRPLLLCTEN